MIRVQYKLVEDILEYLRVHSKPFAIENSLVKLKLN